VVHRQEDDRRPAGAGPLRGPEIARDRGKSTGNVSTAEITDATPGGPSAHISQRACQGPNDARALCPTETKAAGGLGSIAEQQADQRFDVVLGGGRNRYNQPIEAGGTTNVFDYARTKGYTQQPTTAAELANVRSLRNGRVLGLFTPSNMTTEFAPLQARSTAWQAANPGFNPQTDVGSDTTKCVENNRPSNEPSLADMTSKAIDLLDDNPKGFTLQVEGASIDKRNHASDACGQIGELLALDKAVDVALKFQKRNPDTLIIVTADHSHTSQIINSGQTPAPLTAYATVQTVDGAPLRVAYGTATAEGGSHGHTGAQVPVWAGGPQAANIQGTLDQTEIFDVLNGLRPSRADNGKGKGHDKDKNRGKGHDKGHGPRR